MDFFLQGRSPKIIIVSNRRIGLFPFSKFEEGLHYVATWWRYNDQIFLNGRGTRDQFGEVWQIR
jgi:hypothetical protein